MKYYTAQKFRKVTLFILVWSVLVLFVAVYTQSVKASISGCSASISGSPLTVGEATNITISVTNNDNDNTINWVKITRPSSNYTLGDNSFGWPTDTSDSSYTISGFSISGGLTNPFEFYATGASGSSGDNWTVEASSDDGNTTTTCTGSLSTSVLGPAVTISSVTATKVETTMVHIEWATNVAAKADIYYGYGGDMSVYNYTDYVTSGGMYFSGLMPNQTYSYYIVVTAADNQTAQSDTDSFDTYAASTPTPGPTSTPTTRPTSTPTSTPGPSPTVTPTSTPGPSPTPTPTIVPDTTAPTLTLTALTTTVVNKVPEIVGTATDNKGVTAVDYSINDATVWTTLRTLTGSGTTRATFRFSPTLIANGAYTIKWRARDAKGNLSTTQTISFYLDTEVPKVSYQTDFTNPFLAAPTVTGTITDNYSVQSAEYSFDNGVNWQPVDTLTVTASISAQFSFTLPKLEDGNYQVVVKGVDTAGNADTSFTKTLVVDRLPPTIGGMIRMLGPQILYPDERGMMETVVGVNEKITLSVIGGATAVDLTITNSSNSSQKTTYPFVKNPDNGLWSVVYTIPNPGTYTFTAHSIDGAGNIDDKQLGYWKVAPSGIVKTNTIPLGSTQVTVYVFDQDTGMYVLWDGVSFKQTNPQVTTVNGEYHLLLPGGTYYLEYKKPGYGVVRSKIFTLKKPQSITTSIELHKQTFSSIFPWLSELFWAFIPAENIDILASRGLQTPVNSAIFSLANITSHLDSLQLGNLNGKLTYILFTNSWYPSTSEQISVIQTVLKSYTQSQFFVVFPEESSAQVSLFSDRGGYQVKTISDPDAIITKGFAYTVIPTHIVVDKTGKVKSILTGSLNPDRIRDSLKEVGN